MQIAFGATRVVLLTKTKAFKFARIRPIWSAMRLIASLMEGKVSERLDRYHRNPFSAGIRYVLIGVVVNRQEAMMWRKTKDPRFVPTLHSLFGGLVNIQERGDAVFEILAASHPFTRLIDCPGRASDDLMRPVNFCLINDRVLLLDYGGDDFVAAFPGNSMETPKT